MKIWREISDSLTGMDKIESKLFIEERMPRILAAYKSIPKSERDKKSDLLGGVSPREAFLDGMRGARSSAETHLQSLNQEKVRKFLMEAAVVRSLVLDIEKKRNIKH